MFKELLESVREGGKILRGEMEPARRTVVKIPNVKKIRGRMNLTQVQFANLFGISVATLRNWEQGRRIPDGPAQTLLRVADRHPEAILDTVNT
jgi:putative transcriptional regulator